MTKMAIRSIYSKKNFENLSRNRMADDLETWYAALMAQALTDDLNLLQQSQIRSLRFFCLKKNEIVDFSGSVVACDIKVDLCNQLNELL